MVAIAPPPGGPANALRWWSSRELDGISATLARRLRDWLADWSPGAARREARFDCTLSWHSHGLADAQWQPVGAGGGAAWIEGGSAGARRLAAWLSGAGGEEAGLLPTPIAEAVAQRAFQSFTEVVGGVLTRAPGTGSPPATAVFLPWSGAVVASLDGSTSPALRLLIDGACAASLVPRADTGRAAAAAPLTPVAAALAGRPIRARVSLAACDVDLGTLASVRIGDVLSLPHPLDAPAAVNGGGATLCGAYLGSHAGAKAIELTSDTPAPGAGATP